MTDNMPNVLTGPDGRTYYNTGRTRIAIDSAGARRAGWAEGETVFEYWIDPDCDAERLHTTSDFRMQLD